MFSTAICLGLALCFAAVHSQGNSRTSTLGEYRDPCYNKRCGDHGCCVRRDPYYVGKFIRYNQYVCACDEHYYFHRQDDVCRHGCYQNNCHKYAGCYAKRRYAEYPGFNQWNIYLNDTYYCQCNNGYRGNGRYCERINPCDFADCHNHATCHAKPQGSIDYYNYATYKRYVQNSYYCRCNDNYYGNGRQCTHKCFQNTCHQHATCYPKNLGLHYPGSRTYPIYNSNYYYCQCNPGYQGNGRGCQKIDPCSNANCHQWATCHSKPVGSISYYNYATYKGYVQNAYYCRCRSNYFGNGRQCTHKCQGITCGQYSTCVPKTYGQSYFGSSSCSRYINSRYQCRCDEGYRYESHGCRCIPINPCDSANCHPHASCHVKAVGSKDYYNYATYKGYLQNAYFCKCNDNYYGNGRQCTAHCQSDSCHSSAQCVPKPYGSTNYPTYNLYPRFRNEYFYCHCQNGYWNGSRCVTCSQCHRNARCIPKRCGSTDYPGYRNDRYYAEYCYYCQCNQHFFGNGRRCLARSG